MEEEAVFEPEVEPESQPEPQEELESEPEPWSTNDPIVHPNPDPDKVCNPPVSKQRRQTLFIAPVHKQGHSRQATCERVRDVGGSYASGAAKRKSAKKTKSIA